MAAEPRQLPTLSFSRNFWLAPALGTLLGACVGAVNPVTGERDWTLVDEQQEMQIGRETHRQILDQYGYYDRPLLQEYVSQVGQALVPHTHRPELDYRFTVLDDPLVNAFATPGYVYITRGMLAMINSEAELAGVLGHELGHITARHTARRIGQQQTVDIVKLLLDTTTDNPLLDQAANLLGEAHVRGYGRDNELEADRLGARYASLAGYDSHALFEVIRILKNQEAHELKVAAQENREAQIYHGLFATHPENDQRLQAVIQEARQHHPDSEPRVRRKEYLRHIDGMIVGSSEADGKLHGNRFYHRILDFTMALPEGWAVTDLPARLVAEAPSQDMQLRLTLVERGPAQSACDFLYLKFQNLAQLRPRAANGYAGCRALVQEGQPPTKITVMELSSKAFLVTAAQANNWQAHERYDRVVEGSIQSLRPLTKAEYEAARPSRMQIAEAHAGDTYATYSKGADWNPYPEDMLRLFNAAYPSGEPVPGQLVKKVR